MKAITKKLGTLTAMLMMLGTVSFAQERENVGNMEVDEFNQYDANADQQWDRDEFNTRMTETEAFNNWDIDQDGTINEEEFNEGTRNWQNQGVQENAAGTTETTTNTGQFNEWDADGDGALNEDEFNEGTFNQYDVDRDGALTDDEFTNGIGNTGIEENGVGTETDIENE